jgi:hypothetical protein
MRVFAAGLAALALTVGMAAAAPPTTEQKAEFYKTCVGISQNQPLCTCKADAAMELVDGDFMAVIIKSMRGAAPPSQYDVPYNDYIAASTRACGMGGI